MCIQKNLLFFLLFLQPCIIYAAELRSFLVQNFQEAQNLSRSTSKDSIITIPYGALDHVPRYQKDIASRAVTPVLVLEFNNGNNRFQADEYYQRIDNRMSQATTTPSSSSGCCALVQDFGSQGYDLAHKTIKSFRQDFQNPRQTCVNCMQGTSDRSISVQKCRGNVCALAGTCLCFSGILCLSAV